MKKTIALLILTVLLLSMLAGCDMGADKPNPASDFEYSVNPAQNGILISKYIGTSENVVIPAEIEGLPVVSVRGVSPEGNEYAVEAGAFEGTNVKTVVVPKTVIAIGYLAFKDCKELTGITFADGSRLTKIGGSAFEGCTALKEIALPNTVTEIQARAFYGCSALTEVDLPDELTKIGGSAFTECAALKKITIPAKLDLYFINTGDSPLTLVPSLEQIVFEEGREEVRGYALVNGSLDIKITVPGSVKKFSSYLFLVGRDAKTEIAFMGDAPEIVEEGNGNFGVSVIYYDPDTSGWDTFAWKDLYEMKPIED